MRTGACPSQARPQSDGGGEAPRTLSPPRILSPRIGVAAGTVQQATYSKSSLRSRIASSLQFVFPNSFRTGKVGRWTFSLSFPTAFSIAQCSLRSCEQRRLTSLQLRPRASYTRKWQTTFPSVILCYCAVTLNFMTAQQRMMSGLSDMVSKDVARIQRAERLRELAILRLVEFQPPSQPALQYQLQRSTYLCPGARLVGKLACFLPMGRRKMLLTQGGLSYWFSKGGRPLRELGNFKSDLPGGGLSCFHEDCLLEVIRARNRIYVLDVLVWRRENVTSKTTQQRHNILSRYLGKQIKNAQQYAVKLIQRWYLSPSAAKASATRLTREWMLLADPQSPYLSRGDVNPGLMLLRLQQSPPVGQKQPVRSMLMFAEPGCLLTGDGIRIHYQAQPNQIVEEFKGTVALVYEKVYRHEGQFFVLGVQSLTKVKGSPQIMSKVLFDSEQAQGGLLLQNLLQLLSK